MTVEDVIRTHTEGFNRALTTHDLDALSAIYTDDYMLVRPDGSKLTYPSALARAVVSPAAMRDRR